MMKMIPFISLTMSEKSGSIPPLRSRRVQWAESRTFSIVQNGVP